MSEHAPLPWTTSDLASGVVDDLGNGIIICNAANAVFIVKTVNAHDSLIRLLKAANVYYGCYVQDEAEEIEVCISPEQHEAAKALRDALRDCAGPVGQVPK